MLDVSMNRWIYTQRARDFSGRLGEEAVASLLWAKIKWTRKGADLILPDGTEAEVKCRLYGQPVNVLVDQLLELHPEDTYVFLYYRTLGKNVRPIDIIMNWVDADSPYDYFVENIEITKIFLFPSHLTVDFYRNTHMKEWRISSSGRVHKGLSVKSAEAIFDNARQVKSILATPFSFPKSTEVLTYAVGERMNALLTSQWY